MRIVTYGGAVSLDGFLAGADGSIDWLHFSKDVQEVMTNYWKDVDAILMGRKTYEVSVAQNPLPDEKTKESARRTYVFSRTIVSIATPGTEFVSSDAVEFVRNLKQQPGKQICLMGGGELARSLLAADLIDEVGLNIHPILLGSGVPVFRDPGHRVRLKLTECRSMVAAVFLRTTKCCMWISGRDTMPLILAPDDLSPQFFLTESRSFGRNGSKNAG